MCIRDRLKPYTAETLKELPNKGIRDIHSQLIVKIKDAHEVEHMMMEHIAEMIFNAQKNNAAFDLDGYIQALKSL